MFTALLRALADDRPRTLRVLADELGTDAAGLRLALDHCERLGYLERTGSGLSLGCGGGCGKSCSCSAVSACPTSAEATWWRVTERGRRAARLTAVTPTACPAQSVS